MNGNGFTMAYHEIFDEAEGELSNSQFKVFWHIYRQLVGWNRESAEISITKISQKTNISIPTVIAACKELTEKEWIRMEKMGEQKNSPVIFYLSDKLQGIVKLFNNQPAKDEQVIKLFNNQPAKVIKKFNNPINRSKDIYKDNKESIDESVIKKLNKEEQEVRELPAKKPDLLSKLEFLPGIINLTKEEDKRFFEYIKEYNETQVDTVLDEAKRRTKLPSSDKERLQRKSVLKFIAGGLENYDVFYNKTKSGDVMKLDNSIILEANEEMAKLQEQVQKDIKEAGGEAEYRGKLDELINGFVKGE